MKSKAMTKSKPKKITQRRRGYKEPAYQVIDPNINDTLGVPQPEPFSTLIQAYEGHVWVYNCVKAIATNLASIPILPYIQKVVDKKPTWVVDENHELRELLDKPNAYMSGYNLREYTAAGLLLTGNAYWFLEDMKTTEIKEIWPLLPDMVKPVASKTKMIDHYLYRVGSTDVVLPYDRVIQFRLMNPQSFVYGQGALAAAKLAVMSDIFAQVWNKKFFQNSARPDVLLTTDNVLDDDVRKRVIQSWRQLHEGFNNQGKTALLEQGIKAAPFQATSKDLDFVNMRKDLRNEILAAFGVPPSVVGLLEFANYSNMDAQLKMFWTQTVLPLLKNIEDTLTMRAEQITFEFGRVFQGDTTNVAALRPDMKQMADTLKTFTDAGVPLNAVVEALDLPFEPIEGGDESKPLTNRNPVGALSQPAKETKAAKSVRRVNQWKRIEDEMQKAEARFRAGIVGFFRSQRSRVLKRLDDHAQQLLTGSIGKEFKKLEDTIEIIFDLDKESAAMQKATARLIKGVYFDFAIDTINDLAPQLAFDLSDPIANQWIADKTLKLAQEASKFTLETITDEVKDAIQDALASGFSAGETISDVTERIKSVYEFAVEGRAERIARTEVLSAANAGNFEALKRAGVEEKEWLSSQDDRVRETHAELDGRSVPLNQPFITSSGSALMFPGDPSGEPGEIINCRCTLIVPEKNR